MAVKPPFRLTQADRAPEPMPAGEVARDIEMQDYENRRLSWMVDVWKEDGRFGGVENATLEAPAPGRVDVGRGEKRATLINAEDAASAVRWAQNVLLGWL